MADEWIKKMWYICTVEYYSAIKRNEIGSFEWYVLTEIPSKEWSKSDRERQISYGITYMGNLKKWCKWTYLQSRNRVTDIETKGERVREG